ncbi:MAG: disulfide bond formation protein B [Alphaproteobacteria bacterium]
MKFQSCIADPRFPAALVLAASIAVLGGAFAFQYIGGLQPCVLCIYQRYPYAVTIAFSLAAFLTARQNPQQSQMLLYICALAFVIGAGIAVFHVGVEQHWWRGTDECGALSTGAKTLEEMETMLKKTPVVRCDQPQWSLFGISMAGYNVLISLALAAFCIYAPRLKNR